MPDFYTIKIDNVNKISTNLESLIRHWNAHGSAFGFRPGDNIGLESYRDGIMIRNASIIHVLAHGHIYLNPNITVRT